VAGLGGSCVSRWLGLVDLDQEPEEGNWKPPPYQSISTITMTDYTKPACLRHAEYLTNGI